VKTQPIQPARIAFDDGVPVATEFGDVYHARAGALAQAQHVFLRGNELP
jgi:tRNA 5-methylaminomethyl-2-thiouridine biosynthesis bifunctional protein